MTESNWQRSSFCGGGGNNCVEVTATPDGIALRESDTPAEIVTTGRGALLSLIRGVKVGVVTRSTRGVTQAQPNSRANLRSRLVEPYGASPSGFRQPQNDAASSLAWQ
ncbi:DUF397 domain-containing protein [Streptomyces acidicola]|uniref:DUF397 domain-containing protein n=1 Tax=Streptomyces acidicola TaxID=2596892 RepID=UPI0037926764